MLEDPAGEIPYPNLCRLLNEAARRTRCAHFGLLAGNAWQLSDLGLVGEIMRNSQTVGGALQDLILYHHLRSNGAVAFLLRRGQMADLGYAIYAPLAEDRSQHYDAVLAATMNIMRGLCGEEWAPSMVCFPHSAPDDITPYRHCFRAPLRFDSEFCAVRFPASLMTQRIHGADPARFRDARARAEGAGKAELVQAVQRKLRTLLLQGRSAGADVAQSLAMHRRTLSRRLAAEETTFQQILDSVRFASATELLQQSAIPLPDIAAALGYSSLGPFTRAFRRWTGTSPAVWRESAHR
ncbi:MAG TPA: AraC family transcriptional regulator [Burkholderiales bacterium]|nr:AraC family transcriptional regulator [Burkholderiales bacterium]